MDAGLHCRGHCRAGRSNRLPPLCKNGPGRQRRVSGINHRSGSDWPHADLRHPEFRQHRPRRLHDPRRLRRVIHRWQCSPAPGHRRQWTRAVHLWLPNAHRLANWGSRRRRHGHYLGCGSVPPTQESGRECRGAGDGFAGCSHRAARVGANYLGRRYPALPSGVQTRLSPAHGSACATRCNLHRHDNDSSGR